MRMRRKPWARPELDESYIYIKNPIECFSSWQSTFEKQQPLHIEFGCGKGSFISQKGYQNKNINFLAFDIKSEMLALTKRNIEKVYGDEKVGNIRITAFDISRIDLAISEEDKAEVIYINFCNPWPKDRHKKRRLTHTKQLVMYKRFLKKGGKIYFKTDDDELFTESLEYFKEAGFTTEFITYDLHKNSWENNIVTEHETMFTNEGIKIKAIILNHS